MQYTDENLQEINVIMLFKLTTTQEGIKVHKNASQETIAATKRLFQKGLITQEDGGYLTAMGHEAAEHAQNLFGLMNPN